MKLDEAVKCTRAGIQLSVVLFSAMAACGPDTSTTGLALPGASVAGSVATGTTPGVAGASATTPAAAGSRATTPATPGVVPNPKPVAGSSATAPTGATAGGPASGTAGAVASTAGAGAGPAAGSGGTNTSELPTATGPEPKLPEIMGECPALMDGTIMVAGHRGVQIVAGAAGKGGPLLFAWHGTGGSATGALRQIPMGVQREIVDAGGIIAAFNGSSSSGAEGDCSGTGAHNIADFKAADQIAACAVKNHGVDSRRIYATGCSAGGLQSGCMAYERSSYLAAAAPNSGGIVGRRQWQDMSSPAIFTMHGSQSGDVVVVAFADTSRTIDTAAKDHGSFVVNCDHNGGHCAASAELHTAAWEFMKAHPYGTTAANSPWAGGIPAGVPDYCEIF